MVNWRGGGYCNATVRHAHSGISGTVRRRRERGTTETRVAARAASRVGRAAMVSGFPDTVRTVFHGDRVVQTQKRIGRDRRDMAEKLIWRYATVIGRSEVEIRDLLNQAGYDGWELVSVNCLAGMEGVRWIAFVKLPVRIPDLASPVATAVPMAAVPGVVVSPVSAT
ncbi:MAG: hypothetical protein Q4C47_02800, partial [Planctomycetia bacterium]|nr:hypothetical protein [Planctomycetia bacterium]